MATKYYHGTSKECAKQILSKGFKTSYGRFGDGVYLTSNKLNAESFTRGIKKIIECEFLGDMAIINYQELNNLFPCANISIEEEEGYPPLKDYILNMGYDGAKIIYDKETNDDEIVIYNPRRIQSMSIIE